MQLSFNERLKQKRNKLNLTIEQLANLVGCSKSYISQLEHGTAKPSVTMLRKLAEALNIQMSEFLNDKTAANGEISLGRQVNWLRSGQSCLISENERRIINYPDGKSKSAFLTEAVYMKKMQPILTTIEPGGGSNSDDDTTHPEGSEEFLFVLRGEIDFRVDNKNFKLKEGDTFYFDGVIPHSWKNNGTQVAEILFVWTPAVW